MSTKIFIVINISSDLISDVISCCVWSSDAGEINVYEKIVLENQNKRENIKIKYILSSKSI